MPAKRPNILLIMTDQKRFPPPYELEEVRRFRREALVAEESLRQDGVSFNCHYTVSSACAPSRASLLTGHYPSLHGVTQTDGMAKHALSKDMFWLASDTVPTLGNWFRAGGYRTYYKGKWHASHAVLEAPDGKGPLQSIKDDGTPITENVKTYLKADLLDPYGFSEWVGPEPHGLGKQNTGTGKDPFTTEETVALLKRLDQDGSDQPWLTVCSLLNPHDIAIYGIVALSQGLRPDFEGVPKIPEPPTQDEDLSSKPTCHQSYVDVWGKMLAPQTLIQAQRRFYFQLHRMVDQQLKKVLDALRSSKAYENTIVIFTADHGEMLGAHGGMHQKWHNAYEETIHVPFLVSSPLLKGGPRDVGIPTSHADLLPTMLGLAGIDPAAVLKRLSSDHRDARPLAGRDLSGILRGTQKPVSEPVLFVTDDEISEGDDKPSSPFQIYARWAKTYEIVAQPNHVETIVADVDIDGSIHRVKFSRYHDNQQFWTVPGVRDARLKRRKTLQVDTPAPDEYELYDLTLDPLEVNNLAFPGNADDRSRALQGRMFKLLVEQLKTKRLTPSSGGRPGYRPPNAVGTKA
jgi:arylsulfatase A-like enzyme